MVGKSDFKENPKSDLDLDLGFVKKLTNRRKIVEGISCLLTIYDL